MFFATAEGLIGHVGRVSYILVTLIHPVKVEYFSLHAVARFFKKNGPIPASFLFIFALFSLQFQYKLKKAKMVSLGFEPGATGW